MSFLISGHSSIKNEVFSNFLLSQLIKLKFRTGIQNWMLILIFGSKSGFVDDFRQYDTKTIILRRFLAKCHGNT